DCGAGGEITLDRGVDSADASQQRNSPADQQPHRNPARQGDGADSGHDQVTEDEQDAGDADKNRHDDAEGGVEEKIPPAHAPTEAVCFLALEGNEQEILPEDKMDNPDRDKN